MVAARRRGSTDAAAAVDDDDDADRVALLSLGDELNSDSNDV